MKKFRRKEIEKILKNKLEMEVRESGHTIFNLRVDGRLVVRTVLSHQNDISPIIQHAIRKQLHLKPDDFVNLMECPLSKNAYLEILKTKGVI